MSEATLTDAADAAIAARRERLAADAERLGREVFFIVGAPRSGTTLLQAMLSSHPRLYVPPETELYMKLRPPPHAADDERRAHLERYFATAAFSEQGLAAAEVVPLAEVIEARQFDERADQEQPPRPGPRLGRRSIVLAMLALHAERCGAARVGEKSPHHCRHVEEIARELPDACFIHVVRDPRDVVASRLRVPWTKTSHLALARSWRKDIHRHNRLMQTMPPERYMQLRLEDLVAAAEAELRRLCQFLDESFDAAMLRFHERSETGFGERERGWKGGTLTPLDSAAVGRWRERLTPRQVWEVQRLCAAEMKTLGYAPAAIKPRASWAMLKAMDAMGDVAEKISRSARKRIDRLKSR